MTTSTDAAQSGAEQQDWGVFGRPLFLDEEARALSRVGVVDVGSNSVRLVVFDGAARSPAYFYNEKIMCGLGAGLRETGRLNPEGKLRAMVAIRRFQKLAQGMGIPPLTAVATAAVREAEDGPAFREEIERETGLSLWVIDGEEEARLSAQGVLLGWPEADGLVCDIGGSSMELAVVTGGTVGKRLTSPLGPLKLQGLKGGRTGLKDHITPDHGRSRCQNGQGSQTDLSGRRLMAGDCADRHGTAQLSATCVARIPDVEPGGHRHDQIYSQKQYG